MLSPTEINRPPLNIPTGAIEAIQCDAISHAAGIVIGMLSETQSMAYNAALVEVANILMAEAKQAMKPEQITVTTE